ncbi:hypothetical protein PsYK624_067020 [Phanerochaete sordida]|uniref:Uncharacterized protein n=1 Tax=Phanerochaete sordida TaxID=48140 RepID=A0A9P3GAZ4_9APHY|nr:hypothetical protein PsYK624_067020 [Phanerochaete sordida]
MLTWPAGHLYSIWRGKRRRKQLKDSRRSRKRSRHPVRRRLSESVFTPSAGPLGASGSPVRQCALHQCQGGIHARRAVSWAVGREAGGKRMGLPFLLLHVQNNAVLRSV